jgi:hypothetical protein
MRKTPLITLACCAGFGALALAGSKPVLATPAIPTLQHGETSAAVVNVGYRHRGYYGGYGYRPYYGGYGYRRYYGGYGYRPYYGGYGYRSYPYYRSYGYCPNYY